MREGMSGETGTNSPGEPEFTVHAHQLRCRLWGAAKRRRPRRRHACRRCLEADYLWAAWWGRRWRSRNAAT